MRYQHVVVDIETLGTKPGHVVLSAAAVAFNVGEFDKRSEASWGLLMEDGTARGYKINGETLRWWMNQEVAAQEDAFLGKLKVPEFLDSFEQFLKTKVDPDNRGQFELWGMGDFDMPFIREMFERERRPLPWNYWKQRCFRTLRDTINLRDTFVIDGTYFKEFVKHRALDDARHEAVQLDRILTHIANKP